MIIAHLPAGYMLSKKMQHGTHAPALLWAGLLGSVFPDFDLFYFFLIDEQQTFHHHYWLHLPVFWACVTCAVLPFLCREANSRLRQVYLFFLANVWLHLFLDTLVSPMFWYLPFSSQGLQLLDYQLVPLFDAWIWNYMIHPIFTLEIVICALANIVWLRSNLFRSFKPQHRLTH